MSADASKRKHRIGCLLWVVSPLVALFVLYEALFYNPLRLVSRRQLDEALRTGLLAECDRMMDRNAKDSWGIRKEEWAAPIRTLRPRDVGLNVQDGKPYAVSLVLWKNYRDWQAYTVLGLWIDKGAEVIALRINANGDPEEATLADVNDDLACRYFTRRVSNRVYLDYPKAMQREVVKHTDLISLDITSMRPTAGAVIVVKTNADTIISFIESGKCGKELRAKGTRFTEITASHWRGSEALAIRVVASTEGDALKAVRAVITEVENSTDRPVQVVTGPMIVQ